MFIPYWIIWSTLQYRIGMGIVGTVVALSIIIMATKDSCVIDLDGK